MKIFIMRINMRSYSWTLLKTSYLKTRKERIIRNQELLKYNPDCYCCQNRKNFENQANSKKSVLDQVATDSPVPRKQTKLKKKRKKPENSEKIGEKSDVSKTSTATPIQCNGCGKGKIKFWLLKNLFETIRLIS